MRLEPEIKLEDAVVHEIKIPIQKSFGKIGELRRSINGGSIFVFHHESKILGHAKIEDQTDYVPGGSRGKINLMPDCTYLEALNLKNAIERLKKGKILFTT